MDQHQHDGGLLHHHPSLAQPISTTATTSRPSPPLTPSPDKRLPTTTQSHSQQDPASTVSVLLPSSCHDPQYPIQHTLLAVARLLHTVVGHNDVRRSALRDPITLFHSRAVPPISIAAYLARIHRFIPLTNEVLLNAVIYLARLGGAAGSGVAEEEAAASALAQEAVAEVAAAKAERGGAGCQLGESRLGQTLHKNMIHHGSNLVADWLLSSFAVDGSAATTPMLSTAACSSINPGASSSGTAASVETGASSSSPPSSSTHAPSSLLPTCAAAQGLAVVVDGDKNAVHTSIPHEQCRGPLVGYGCTTTTKVCTSAAAATASASQLHDDSTSALSNTAHAPCSAASHPTTIPRANKRPRSPTATSLCASTVAGPASTSHEDSGKRVKQHPPPLDTLSALSTPSCPSSSTVAPWMTAKMIAPASSQTPLMPNGFRLNSLNIHRLLITALMIAAKFTSDLYYSNARYAKYGGLRLEELNQLELEFLFAIKFDLNVKVPHIEQVGRTLHVFEQQASAIVSASSMTSSMSSSPSPASTPSMVAIDQFPPTPSSATHPSAHGQQQYLHSSQQHQTYPSVSTTSTSYSSTNYAEATVHAQGQDQGQSQSAPHQHMQQSSKIVGHLLSPPEEKQQGWDE